MSLIASVSGIRGTIGGEPGFNLTPIDIIRFTASYASLLHSRQSRPKVIVGRDGRISGELVSSLVISCLQSMGIEVVQIGLTTTPTIEMAIIDHHADGGIMISASHNPKEWNALKLLNNLGEFISPEEGELILNTSKSDQFRFSEVQDLGNIYEDKNSIQKHIDHILKLNFIPVDLIRSKKYRVVADCINSTGALALPALFDAFNIQYQLINSNINGEFAHNPEPLPEHLTDLMDAAKQDFHIGFAVDPDVDRLACVDEIGNYFGEEYTLVAAADYMLEIKSGNTVSNLSSSRALKVITEAKGGKYFASSVGEVHVVRKMKEVNAVIGGEGNGGVICPDLHYGRDALIGIALILSNLAVKDTTLSNLKKSYPQYFMYKDKLQLNPELDFNKLIQFLVKQYPNDAINLEDGMKIDFADSWIHLRKSNTEPIVRIYSESRNSTESKNLCEQIKSKILQF